MRGIKGGFLVRGLVAGAIGAWVMDRATWALQDREAKEALRRERRAWPDDLDVSHLLGYRLAEAAGVPAMKDQPSTLGMATHYALSILPAIAYAALRERNLDFARDYGLLYGFAIFLLWDETLSVATGIASPPQAYPWQAHLRGLVGHLSLGVATHAALTALETDFGVRPLTSHPGAEP